MLDISSYPEYHQWYEHLEQNPAWALSLSLRIVFGCMAMRALKTQQYWEGLVRAHERALAKVRQANIDLVEKKKLDNGNLGTKFAREELLYRVLPGRGAVWEDCVPLAIKPETGQVTLTTDRPTGITDKKLLYLVEEADVPQGRAIPRGVQGRRRGREEDCPGTHQEARRRRTKAAGPEQRPLAHCMKPCRSISMKPSRV